MPPDVRFSNPCYGKAEDQQHQQEHAHDGEGKDVSPPNQSKNYAWVAATFLTANMKWSPTGILSNRIPT